MKKLINEFNKSIDTNNKINFITDENGNKIMNVNHHDILLGDCNFKYQGKTIGEAMNNYLKNFNADLQAYNKLIRNKI